MSHKLLGGEVRSNITLLRDEAHFTQEGFSVYFLGFRHDYILSLGNQRRRRKPLRQFLVRLREEHDDIAFLREWGCSWGKSENVSAQN